MSTNDKYVSWSGFADLSITKYLITSTKYGTGKNAFYCRPAVNLGFDLYFQASYAYYFILKGSLNNF